MEPNLKELVVLIVELLDQEVQEVVVSEGGRTVISITAPTEALIGTDGEHLRALNTVVRRLVEQKYGEQKANFLIDVNGYYNAQMEKVRDTARMLAQRARLFKHEVEMSPMNAYERLIVHELFASDPEIETRSEGEGKFRHVVLKPKT